MTQRSIKTTVTVALAVASGLLAAAFTACSTEPNNSSVIKSGGIQTGQYQGYERINAHLRETMLSQASLDSFFRLGADTFGFQQLVGGFQNLQGRQVYQNGDPNALNAFLWEILMGNVSAEVAANCEVGSAEIVAKAALHEAFSADLSKHCEGRSAETFAGIWYWLVGFESESERQELYAALEAELPGRSVADELYAILMNPTFLLEK